MKTHCVHGHPMTDGNVVQVRAYGVSYPACRTCRRAQRRVRDNKRYREDETFREARKLKTKKYKLRKKREQEDADRVQVQPGLAPEAADHARPGDC